MARITKPSKKLSTPKTKSSGINSQTPRSTSRRNKVVVKSFRESPSSEDDSDEDDSEGSSFEQDDEVADVQGESTDTESEVQSEDEEDEDEDEEIPRPKKRKIEATSTENDHQKSGGGRDGQNKEEFDESGRSVTELVKAPKEHVPSDQISSHLMELMSELSDPAKNDRDWFKARDPFWRYVEKNWNAFVTSLVTKLMDEVDETLPFLPYKDCVYRIYRDIRLCHDKTPYRSKMMATLGRGGRKGGTDFASYHLEVGKNQSSFSAGWWSPTKNNLDLIRKQIIENTECGQKLKEIISSKDFVEMFGEPKEKTEKKEKVKKEKGKEKKEKVVEVIKRSNLWGSKDELKKAPKMEGVTPDHPEIEWLKLKSFWVEKKLTDEEVLSPEFQDRICEIAEVMKPLVQTLNDLVYPPPPPPED